MATATELNITTADTGVFNGGPRDDSAVKASKVLKDDMENHHIFFNDMGFHNHIVHHVLSIYALGASPDAIQEAYNRGASYQKHTLGVDEAVVQKLSDRDQFRKLCGNGKLYPSFLTFFQREIDAKGVGPVVNEYVFAGDEYADDMLIRLLDGLIHPWIHLGYGLEFNQPAVVAQGLAQTAVHGLRLASFFTAAEKAAGGIGLPGMKTLIRLQNEMRSDKKLRTSTRWSDTNKIWDGVMARADQEMINYASQFTVGPEQMDEKLAELINAVVYFTAAAQNPRKQIKFDFFYMHCVNSSIFLPTYISQPWMSQRSKLRLLEWKGRYDLLIYASRGCSEPHLEDIVNHKARKSWKEVFDAVNNHDRDDGHAAKLVRTIAYGEQICKPFEGKDNFVIKGDMWLKLANMAVDSIQDPGALWVRSAGFEEAWADVPDRARL